MFTSLLFIYKLPTNQSNYLQARMYNYIFPHHPFRKLSINHNMYTYISILHLEIIPAAGVVVFVFYKLSADSGLFGSAAMPKDDGDDVTNTHIERLMICEAFTCTSERANNDQRPSTFSLLQRKTSTIMSIQMYLYI